MDCSQDQVQLTTSDKAEPASSTAIVSEEMVGFFKLPRELRDAIYDLLFVGDEHEPYAVDKAQITEGVILAYATNVHASVPQARLLSRRFKADYGQRSASKDHIVLTSNCYLDIDAADFCSTISNRATELRIDYRPSPRDYEQECLWCDGFIATDWTRLDSVARLIETMPMLNHIRINLHGTGSDVGCISSRRLCAISEFYTTGVDGTGSGFFARLVGGEEGRNIENDRLSRFDLEISWYGRADDGSEEDVRFAIWTPKAGLQTDVGAAKRCKKNVN